MANHFSARSGRYCELHAHSYYSLLDGVPTPEQLVERAAELGLPALALTDHDAVYGLPSFAHYANEVGLKPILGAELTLEDGSHLTLLAENNTGYTNLCRLITAGRLNAANGDSRLPWNTLRQHTGGLLCLTGCRKGPVARRVAENDLVAADRSLVFLIDAFGQNNVYVELQRHLGRDDIKISRRLAALASERGLPYVATGNVHYLQPDDGNLQSALVSLRERIPLPKAGHLLRPTHEYFLRSPKAMLELFADMPEAVRETLAIAERCEAVLPAALQSLPKYPTPSGLTAPDYLRQLCLEALSPKDTPAQLDAELLAISQLNLADYFLILWDIAEFCQRRNILYHGRGAATNGLVARLLGLSAINPTQPASFELGHIPDLSLDIDLLQRETVVQYVTERWGYDHVEMPCRFTTLGAISAVREAGFVLGFEPKTINDILSVIEPESEVGNVPSETAYTDSIFPQLVEGLRARAPGLTAAERRGLIQLAQRLHGRPREVSAEPGTLILSGSLIADLVPVQPVRDTNAGQTAIQFDKDWLASLGLAQIDFYGQGLLTALADTLLLVRDTRHDRVELHQLNFGDKAVYDLICSARTIGVFQTDPAAEASLIPCIQPKCFQDLVVEASLMLRPSPLRGSMVQHYRLRRLGLEPVSIAQPLLQPPLEETLGVLIFQEQAVQIVREVAGFAPARSELFRRALSSTAPIEAVERFKSEFIEGALRNQVTFETAEQIWNMVYVFAGYSFSKQQAAGVAAILYWAAWLRLRYPVEYFCGQLRFAPPGGSYASTVLEAEARRAGLKLLAFDVNRSKTRPIIEREAIRFGLSRINGVDETIAEAILQARGSRPFRSLTDLIQRARLDRRVLEWLILAGALDSLGERPHLLWELAEAFDITRRPQPPLVDTRDSRDDFTDFDLDAEPRLASVFALSSNPDRLQLTKLRRDAFTKAGCLTWDKLRKAWVGSRVKVGGLVTNEVKRPASAGGTAFLRIAEPEGSIDVAIPEDVYLKCREALRSAFLIIEGSIQSQGAIVTVTARKVQAL